MTKEKAVEFIWDKLKEWRLLDVDAPSNPSLTFEALKMDVLAMQEFTAQLEDELAVPIEDVFKPEMSVGEAAKIIVQA